MLRYTTNPEGTLRQVDLVCDKCDAVLELQIILDTYPACCCYSCPTKGCDGSESSEEPSYPRVYRLKDKP